AEKLAEEKGVRTKRLTVSHAFHSELMDPMLEEFEALAGEISFSAPKIPVISNVTGKELSEEKATSPAYWASQVRQPVRFLDGLQALTTSGAAVMLELGPDPVLTAMSAQLDDPPRAFSLLRKGQSDELALTTGLFGAAVSGVKLDGEKFFANTGAKKSTLPTYAFQRTRYWLEASIGTGDARQLGLGALTHPLLGSATHLAKEDEWLLTGRISLATHPWLTDHRIMGAALFPGTGFAELALAAASSAGLTTIEELVLEAPLVIPEDGAVQIQVALGSPGEDGEREIEIHSRADAQDVEESDWVRHASGILAERAPQTAGHPDLTQWPPEGAKEIETAALYEGLAEAGYEYGPAFQGLTRAWRMGDVYLVEISLSESVAGDFSEYVIHPALFDSALHAMFFGADDGEDNTALPFSFNHVWGSAGGNDSVRVALKIAEDTVTLTTADSFGVPMFGATSIATRPIDLSTITNQNRRRHDSIFVMRWKELATNGFDAGGTSIAVLGEALPGISVTTSFGAIEEIARAEDPPDAVIAVLPSGTAEDVAVSACEIANHVLALTQTWLADSKLDDSRLVFVTRNALSIPGDRAPNLAQSAAVGLIRTAQAEQPGRFQLLDLADDTVTTMAAAVESSEAQVALRGEKMFAPRLAADDESQLCEDAGFDSEGTVLITGGTGSIGSLIARHLVERHGVKHLLLTSRRGADSPSASALVDELEQLGAHVRINACDISDRDATKRLLAGIDDEHALQGVIHAAGVVDDGLIESMTPRQVEAAMLPKAKGAWNLHELTKQISLKRFVSFSSVAGTIGSAGQSNYAAANAFLDALAVARSATGLPAQAIAWGPWELDAGMTAELSVADRARISRLGRAITAEAGLQMFDTALQLDSPALAAVELDAKKLRGFAEDGQLPSIFEGLVRVRRYRGQGAKGSLEKQLEGVTRDQQPAMVLKAVLEQAAAVLGHSSTGAIDPEAQFKDLGFDSLSAVEFRNRLTWISGLRLPASLIFDRPTLSAVAKELSAGLSGGLRAIDGIERELTKVETQLQQLDLDATDRRRLYERLQQFSSKSREFGLGDAANAVPATDGEAAIVDIDSVSDDALFEILDKELG
ncbi:MAG: type I polyketide synthase, partial [Solirubrobacterales bacterium]